MVRELPVDELVWRCPEDWIQWQRSDEIEPASTIVGQDRAVEAIAFGLAVESIGYNVFVTGLSGTGKLTTIKTFLDQLASDETRPDDVCCVYNFRSPEEPCALFLEAGEPALGFYLMGGHRWAYWHFYVHHVRRRPDLWVSL